MDTQVIDQTKLESFVMHAIGDLSAGYAGIMVSIGSKLGLYKNMAGAGPISSKSWRRVPDARSATCASG